MTKNILLLLFLLSLQEGIAQSLEIGVYCHTKLKICLSDDLGRTASYQNGNQSESISQIPGIKLDDHSSYTWTPTEEDTVQPLPEYSLWGDIKLTKKAIYKFQIVPVDSDIIKVIAEYDNDPRSISAISAIKRTIAPGNELNFCLYIDTSLANGVIIRQQVTRQYIMDHISLLADPRNGAIKTSVAAQKYQNLFAAAYDLLYLKNYRAARSAVANISQQIESDKGGVLTDDEISVSSYHSYEELKWDAQQLDLAIADSALAIKSLNPASVQSGSETLVLTINGEGFTPDCMVLWNNVQHTSLYLSDTTLTIQLSREEISNPSTVQLIVMRPAGSQSAPKAFVIRSTTMPQVYVKLVNSTSQLIPTGGLQYYEGGWKDATKNSDGTFIVTTTQAAVSLRMTYEYGSQQKDNVTVGSDTVIFHTVPAQIKLVNSTGNPIDTGSVQYYAGAWRNFGVTTNGIATKELLPNSYQFRMTYAFASKDKTQDIGTSPVVTFATVPASVELHNSQNALMDQGTVQYYSGAWREFGATSNGVATKELLPNNYQFRMTYAYASKDKTQDIGTNPVVTFATVPASVELRNSQNTLMDQGTVQYYSGAWREFGATSSGVATKELLPNNYQFRMTYAYASLDKTQDLNTNPKTVFSTTLCTVRVKNSQSNPVNNATVSYYSGAWRVIGTTVSGEIAKELLPVNLQFRAKLGTVQQDKTQNIATNPIVEISLSIP